MIVTRVQPYVCFIVTNVLVLFQARFLPFQLEACEPRQCVKGDPKDTVPVPYHEPLENTTHTVLKVQGSVSPGPKRFPVNVFNGSKGMKIPVTVRSTDTIEKLQQEVLKLSPDLGASLNLVYNGKNRFQLHQTLSELQVKPEPCSFTYQKCRGG